MLRNIHAKEERLAHATIQLQPTPPSRFCPPCVQFFLCSYTCKYTCVYTHTCTRNPRHSCIHIYMWLKTTGTLITPEPEPSRAWIPTPWLHFISARFPPSLDSPQTTTTTYDSINSFHTSPLACMETSSALLIGRVQITAVALAANHYSMGSLNVANQACLVYYALCE